MAKLTELGFGIIGTIGLFSIGLLAGWPGALWFLGGIIAASFAYEIDSYKPRTQNTPDSEKDG